MHPGVDRCTKIAIYGGSFNPIHAGHVQTVMALLGDGQRENPGLVQKVYVLPSPCSPFKTGNSETVDAYHRCKLCDIALKQMTLNPEYPQFIRDWFKDKIVISPYEIVHFGTAQCAYTVDTLKRIVCENVFHENQYYFVMGVDSFNSIEKFKDYGWLLNSGIVKIIIIPRKGYEVDRSLLNDNCIYAENINIQEISSTELRRCIGSIRGASIQFSVNKKNLQQWLPNYKESLRYMHEHKLYGL